MIGRKGSREGGREGGKEVYREGGREQEREQGKEGINICEQYTCDQSEERVEI